MNIYKEKRSKLGRLNVKQNSERCYGTGLNRYMLCQKEMDMANKRTRPIRDSFGILLIWS